MKLDFGQLTEEISQNVPKPGEEYVGADGLLHCSVCHRATQTKVEFLGIKKTVRCICDCKKRELEADIERARQEERDRKRKICFEQANMASWTFENDDGKNQKISNAMQRYADSFADFKKQSKGLLLHGTVGTGKSYMAACIANRLIDRDYQVLMTNFARLTNQIQGMFEGKQEFIDSLNNYDLLIIDDLGVIVYQLELLLLKKI